MSENSISSDSEPKTEFLKAENWIIDYGTAQQSLRAVNDVSFTLHKGETLGLVGESGSGKSTIAKGLVKLAPLFSGRYEIEGKDVSQLSVRSFFPYRKKIQLIFQDPYQSLNPSLTIDKILAEPFRVHFPDLSNLELKDRSVALLEKVGLHPDDLSKKPAQFSGGQRQRIVIARALAVEPECLICDEAVSALDVSVQAQILNLLKDIQEAENLTLLFISHDLAVVDFMCDQIAVMYKGKIVETNLAKDLYQNPQHPYSKELLNACPDWNS